MERFLEIGKVAGTHGLKGTLRVFPTTDDPERFLHLKEVLIEKGGERKPYAITKAALHKSMILLNVKEIDDINQAEQYKGAGLWVPETAVRPLEENEYFFGDLYGLSVETDTGEVLGTLTDVYRTGANDVYAVKKEGEKELLIPAIRQCILSVDVPAGRMVVHLLEGLR